jgi:hypothetical protein
LELQEEGPQALVRAVRERDRDLADLDLALGGDALGLKPLCLGFHHGPVGHGAKKLVADGFRLARLAVAFLGEPAELLEEVMLVRPGMRDGFGHGGLLLSRFLQDVVKRAVVIVHREFLARLFDEAADGLFLVGIQADLAVRIGPCSLLHA